MVCIASWDVLNTRFRAGAHVRADVRSDVLANISHRSDATAHSLLALLHGVTSRVCKVAGPLRNVAAGFFAAHGRKQNADPKSKSKSKQEAFHHLLRENCSMSLAHFLKMRFGD